MIAVLLFLVSTAALAAGPYEQAVESFQNGEYGETLTLLDQIAPGEQGAAVYNLRSLALMRLQRYDQAIRASEQAQKLNPAEANYVYNAAMIYLASDDPRAAEKTLRSALESFPDSPRLHEGLGEVLYTLSQLRGAEREFRQALALDPANGNAQVALAKLLYALGDREGFAGAAAEAIRLAPNNYLACYYYGKLLEEQRDQIAEGRKYIEKSCALSPAFTDGWIALGRLWQRDGRWSEAAAAYERATTSDPKNAQAYYLLSLAYRKVGNLGQAEQALDRYRRLQKQ